MAPTGGTELYANHSVVLCLVWILLLPNMRCSEGLSLMSFDKNPVYSGEEVIATCSFPADYVPIYVIVDAFYNSRKLGSLFCNRSKGNTTSHGVLNGRSFRDCPVYPARQGTFSIVMQASKTLDLEYICLVRAFRDKALYTFSSSSTRLKVQDPPEASTLHPEMMLFKEGEHVELEFPAATNNITLTTRMTHTNLFSVFPEWTWITLALVIGLMTLFGVIYGLVRRSKKKSPEAHIQQERSGRSTARQQVRLAVTRKERLPDYQHLRCQTREEHVYEACEELSTISDQDYC